MEMEKIPQETPMAQAPIENDPIHKSFLNQKGSFLLILGVIFIILVVFGVGAYYLNKLNTATVPTDQTQKTDVLKEIRNEESNFLFKYPSDKLAKITCPGPSTLGIQLTEKTATQSGDEIYKDQCRNFNEGISIFPYDYEREDPKFALDKGYRKEEILISGVKANKFIGDLEYKDKIQDSTTPYIVINLNYKGKNYVFWLFNKNLVNEFNFIVSSFEFLDQDPNRTASWSTYKDDRFSLKYPKEWFYKNYIPGQFNLGAYQGEIERKNPSIIPQKTVFFYADKYYFDTRQYIGLNLHIYSNTKESSLRSFADNFLDAYVEIHGDQENKPRQYTPIKSANKEFLGVRITRSISNGVTVSDVSNDFLFFQGNGYIVVLDSHGFGKNLTQEIIKTIN